MPFLAPEGYVPAHDPDIVPDAASATALAKSMPENAYWQISPLKRCQQTAAQIEKAMIELGRPIAVQKILTPEIIEQDLGDWAGAKLDDVWAELESAPRHNFSFQTADLIPPNGESFAQQYQRIADFMTDFSARISQETAAPYLFRPCPHDKSGDCLLHGSAAGQGIIDTNRQLQPNHLSFSAPSICPLCRRAMAG